MRDAPAWFSEELRRIGGVNPYGEPVLKLVWSPTEHIVIGGRFNDGFEGYRERKAIHGSPCWALMIWEPRELMGSPVRWEWDYRDENTGYLQIGGFPKYGRYRLLRKFIHHEMVDGQLLTWRMEPCGLMLDLMMPMLIRWQRMTDEARRAALLQEEQFRKDEVSKKLKDAWEGRYRVRRSSALIQKRVEIIERGMEEAMRIAAKTGLGIQQMPA